jgi:tetratricopeptide (TPR) repeat protein
VVVSAPFPPTHPSLATTERQRWTAYYENLLREQLTQTINYMHHCPPAKLASHLGSLLALLRRTRPRPELHPLAAELTAALHPWPLSWGYWEAWEREVRFATQVFARLNQSIRHAEFLSYLADILFNTGRLGEALTIGKQAIVLARTSHAVVPLSITGCAVVSTLIAQGRSNDGERLLEELQEEVACLPTASRDRTVAMARLGLQQLTFLRKAGRLDKAVAQATEIIARLEALPATDERLVAEAYRERSTMQWARDHYSEAIQDIQQAIRMFARQGDLFAEADARGNLGVIYWTMTELDLAEEGIRHVIAIAERLNARWHLTYAFDHLGLAYLSKGQLQQAFRSFERAIALATSTGDTKQAFHARGDQAVVRLYLGEYEAALHTLEKELAFTEGQRRSQKVLAVNYILLSLCHAGLGQHTLALQLSEQAWDIAQEIGSTSLQTLALRCLAEHQPPPVRTELLRQALASARRCQRRLDEAACLLELASLAENKDKQVCLWNQGGQLLERIGAAAWLKGCSPQHPPRIVILM